MQIGVFLIVLLAVSSMIPALTVAVILFLRQEALRGDINEVRHQSTLVNADVKNVLSLIGDLSTHSSDIDLKMATLSGELHAIPLKMANIEESFVALSNKWNSRERFERAEEKRRRREEEDKGESIPGTEQQMLPFPLPPQPPAPAQHQKPERKFGSLP
jgi:hypothetical protein